MSEEMFVSASRRTGDPALEVGSAGRRVGGSAYEHFSNSPKAPIRRSAEPPTRIAVASLLRRFAGSPVRRIVPALLLLAACVSLDELPPGSVPGATSGTAGTPGVQSFPDLDPGASQITTLHFTIKGYSDNDMRPIGAMAESLYNKIGNDTGLYSFLASGNHTLVIYRDREEYLSKTHQPSWSRAVTAGGAIYVYPGQDLEPVLAHELTHLLFNTYMGEKAPNFRWINEGIAMYEEVSKMSDSDRVTWQQTLNSNLRQNKVPFSQMTFFVPATEERRRVDTWYQQVCSVVTFLFSQASPLNFANMLNALRSGYDIDRALSDNYPGKFRSLNELEQSWKYTI